MNPISYFDIHSHIHGPEFDMDREAVLERMRQNAVATITVGTDYEDSKKAVELAEQNDHVWASIGVHPADNTKAEFDEGNFEELAKSKRVVAVGECGLDYFRLEGGSVEEKQRQKDLFARHIAFAKKHNLPLMIHARPSAGTMDAYEDVYEMLKGNEVKANMHFFAGNLETAKKFIGIGCTLSFTGVITFTRQYDEVIKFAPIDRIMAETDAPYVAPEPYRGKRNEPVFVVETLKKLAELKEITFEEVSVKLSENVMRFVRA